ncbi:DUF6924 domain-containing protein [Embleya sp. NPDC059237]|uniref:DUF6924 domain-containing protein n=1 Tax=Embleya sp. NPDC059237 TaxID=3346784 RepID=UPI0036BC9268
MDYREEIGVLPPIEEHGEFTAVVIRTDYTDDAAWAATVAELSQRPDVDADLLFVEDPGWADAEPDDIVATARRSEDTFVLFVADRHTMRSADHRLLALDTLPEDEYEDPDPVDGPPLREFRTVPAGVHDVQANLAIANLSFWDYAEHARSEPDGVYHSFPN